MPNTPTPTRKDLEEAVKQTESMAQQSERYARRDPGQQRGAIVARSRATQAKTRLAEHLALTQPLAAPPSVEEMLAYDQLAGDISNVSFLFRTGDVGAATQQAISVKLACIARSVRKIERFFQEASDKVDEQPEGVPYNGRPRDV